MKTLKVKIVFEIEADPADAEQVAEEIRWQLEDLSEDDFPQNLEGVSVEGDEDEEE